jgi:hypothetical protein
MNAKAAAKIKQSENITQNQHDIKKGKYSRNTSMPIIKVAVILLWIPELACSKIKDAFASACT